MLSGIFRERINDTYKGVDARNHGTDQRHSGTLHLNRDVVESLQNKMSCETQMQMKLRTPRRGDSSSRTLHSSRLILRGRVLYCFTRLFVVHMFSTAVLR